MHMHAWIARHTTAHIYMVTCRMRRGLGPTSATRIDGLQYLCLLTSRLDLWVDARRLLLGLAAGTLLTLCDVGMLCVCVCCVCTGADG
jgi:hypothetical protein